MRGYEIVRELDGIDPAVRDKVIDAILALDRMAYGANRRLVDEMEAFVRLERFITKCGSADAAAKRLGIGKAYLSDIRHSRRPANDAVLAAIGLERQKIRKTFFEMDVPDMEVRQRAVPVPKAKVRQRREPAAEVRHAAELPLGMTITTYLDKLIAENCPSV